MGRKISGLFRRTKSKGDLTYAADKPYAEVVVNRAALAAEALVAEGRNDVETYGASHQHQMHHTPHHTPSRSIGSTGSSGRVQPPPSMSSTSAGSSLYGGGAISTSASIPSSNYSSSGHTVTAQSVVSGLTSAADPNAYDARKLVIQYFLQDAESTYGDRVGPRKLGTGMAVKVKARVENAPLSLEECVQVQREEDKKVERMDRVGRRYYDKYERQGFVHCVAPPSSSIDASDAIGLVSNYVVAYRSLHRTCERPLRRHDKVLVTNAHGSLGRALVELAVLAGASVVFGVSPPKYHDRMTKWGATPLDENNSREWSELLWGSVDIVIDTDAGNSSAAAPLVANQATGKLVRILTGPNAGGDIKIWRKKNSLIDQPLKTCYYDVFHDMEDDPSGFRSDLDALFELMRRGDVKPKKKKAIPLLGVSYIELKFERRPANQQLGSGASHASATSPLAPAAGASHPGHRRSKSSGSSGYLHGRGIAGGPESGRSKSVPRTRATPEEADRNQLRGGPEGNLSLNHRSRSAPRGSSGAEAGAVGHSRSSSGAGGRGMGWDDDEMEEIARSARQRQVAEERSQSSKRSERSKSAPRTGGTGAEESFSSSSSSRHIRKNRSSGSTGERSKSAPRTRERFDDAADPAAPPSRHRMSDEMAERALNPERRSRSAPRVRSSANSVASAGSRGDETARSESRSRGGGSRKMKSGRTDRSSKSAPRGQRRWNDENDGSAHNGMDDGGSRSASRGGYSSKRRGDEARQAKVFDFSFW